VVAMADAATRDPSPSAAKVLSIMRLISKSVCARKELADRTASFPGCSRSASSH
jgi:hypothetical protein